MANNEDLVSMGFTAQEIAQVEALSKKKSFGGLYESTWTHQQNANWAANDSNTRREAAIKDIINKRGGGGSGQKGGSASGSESSSFSGIEDPQVYAQLKGKLSGMIAGTDTDIARAKQFKEQSINQYDQLLANYSKQGAFTDAAALMQQNLSSAMEANKPAIQRAMEGAGTSAGSMQALLSQQLADKASLSAGALGAQQAVSYGQIAAQLMGGRGQLTTGRDAGVSDIAMIGDLLKISRGNQNSYSNFDPASMMNAETNRMLVGGQLANQTNAVNAIKSAARNKELDDAYAKINSTGFSGDGIKGFGGYSSVAEYDTATAAAEKKKRDDEKKKRDDYRAQLDAQNARYQAYTSSTPAYAGKPSGSLTNETTGQRYQFS